LPGRAITFVLNFAWLRQKTGEFKRKEEDEAASPAKLKAQAFERSRVFISFMLA